ncbi:hypothetical protein CJ030_MR5G010141 [Morella rubra]|uniref:Uncharacterized protein n=1 Tax=Morella rubra TaxID=262757 RepID=A0A6A1VJ30_9ROSI|nr:hypothetical protein CJ030_MR5G010141 [Morella rubra]
MANLMEVADSIGGVSLLTDSSNGEKAQSSAAVSLHASNLSTVRMLYSIGIQVNFDVALRDTFAVGAAVLRDHYGRMLGACVKEISVEDSEEGEIGLPRLGWRRLGAVA